MSRNLYPLRTIVALFLSLFAVLSLSAAPVSEKSAADSLYAAKIYAEAGEMYAHLADSIESSELYYNLGNAEYQLKHYGRAILAYERALRIDPGNEEAQYNITLVRTRIADRFADPSEMFFISWFRAWVSSDSVAHWTLLSFGWLVAFFAGLILYFIGQRMWVRKTGFFAALFCALAFLLTTIFAIVQRWAYANNSDAIIMAEEIQCFSSPSTSSKQLRLLHEGTKVTVLDLQKDGWLLVALPDATEGYLQQSQIEFVTPHKQQ